ncbi:MAG: ComF family protein [Bacillota bacterium]|nr:ComF family protein [Bacillota bacterium]
MKKGPGEAGKVRREQWGRLRRRGSEAGKELKEGLLELLYPSNIYCICCGASIDDGQPYSLCGECMENIHWAADRVCRGCGRILTPHRTGELCGVCRERRFSFERGFSCVQYGIIEKEMLYRFKYREQAYYGEKLAQLMYERLWPEEPGPVAAVPVPMSPRRERQRGYNQAALLAKGVAARLGSPFYGDLLVRRRETAPMNRLGRTDRAENVADVFALKRGGAELIKGKRILLVDDILTTGSTAEACSRALLAEGAGSVWLLTFAAVPDWSDAGVSQVCG